MLRACLRACTQCGLVWSDFWLLEQIKKYGGVSSEFLWLDHWFWIYWPVHARCCVRACTQGGLRHRICCCWNKYAKIMGLRLQNFSDYTTDFGLIGPCTQGGVCVHASKEVTFFVKSLFHTPNNTTWDWFGSSKLLFSGTWKMTSLQTQTGPQSDTFS